MIDRASGSVGFPSWAVRLGPSTTRAQFLDSPLAREADINVNNEPWCSWKLPAAQWKGKTWHVTAFFRGQELARIDIAAGAPEFGTSWDDWSMEKEMLRKAFHEEVLASELGPQPHAFPWGEVKSVYDSIGGGSLVIVEYPMKLPRRAPRSSR